MTTPTISPPPVAPRAVDQILYLTIYNSVPIPQGQNWQLAVSGAAALGAGPFIYNVLNLGPGEIYMRGDGADPFPGDWRTETLPANTADNGIFIYDGQLGLRVFAGAGGATVVIRVAVPEYA